MKKLLAGLLALWSLSVCGQEKLYKGKFINEGGEGEALVNMIQLRLQEGGFSISFHLRLNVSFQLFKDKKDHSRDYTDISGSGSGSVAGNELSGRLKMDVEENDAGTFSRNQPPARLEARLSGNGISGEMAVGDEEPTILSFELVLAGDEKPELTFPAGKSPKVFDKGWVFGASFLLMDEKGKLLDLSDQVEWSGTAAFQPARGKESRPAFHQIGTNRIILTVQHEGKTYRNEFPVETVSGLLYAHTGTMAQSMADAHGCFACPHRTLGSVATGTKLVLADGWPAARTGDKGATLGCCGISSFIISGGDPEVLIQGVPAARIGSATKHCGGEGVLIGGYWETASLYNSGIELIRNEKAVAANSPLQEGDQLKTGAAGFFGFWGNAGTLISLFPTSLLHILRINADELNVQLNKGSLLVNGNTGEGRKISVQMDKLMIKPRGTKFLATAGDAGAATVFCYEGSLLITGLRGEDPVTVDSGYGYRFDGSKGTVEQVEAGSFPAAIKEQMSRTESKSMQAQLSEEKRTPAGNKAGEARGLFSRYKYFMIGAAVLILFVVVSLLRRKGKNQ